jgi:hypothetical protein
MTIAFLAVLAQASAPLRLFPRVMASTRSMLIFASTAALAQTLALLQLLRLNNLWSRHSVRYIQNTEQIGISLLRVLILFWENADDH